jgi:hypothetical protein
MAELPANFTTRLDTYLATSGLGPDIVNYDSYTVDQDLYLVSLFDINGNQVGDIEVVEVILNT